MGRVVWKPVNKFFVVVGNKNVTKDLITLLICIFFFGKKSRAYFNLKITFNGLQELNNNVVKKVEPDKQRLCKICVSQEKFYANVSNVL